MRPPAGTPSTGSLSTARPRSRSTAAALAGIELDFGVGSLTIGAGVEGGVFASVDFTLHDPNHDGKVRFGEIADSIKNFGLTGIFDTSGDLHAGLAAFIEVILEIDL